MNLPNQIESKLMLAFEGRRAPAEVLERLQERAWGGFSLFRALNYDSPAQVRALTSALQQAAAAGGFPPLLIATDQEGGQLNAMGDGTTHFAGNMALGATRDPELAYQVGLAIGRELSALGININYAPICDINTNPANPSLGVRSISDDPGLAARIAAALVAGFQTGGVAATVKHFPGKGQASVDSHYGLPVIDHSRERLNSVELVPFKAALNAGAKLIMTGHFAIPSLTGTDEVPATLARNVMHDLVREELGFTGVVITDALDMGAITQGVGQIIDVIAAVRAGVDLMLLTANPETQARIEAGLKLAFSRGLLEDHYLTGSAERILALKTWAGSQTQPDLDVIGSSAHRALAQELAERSITLVRDSAGLLPLRLPSEARILAVMPVPKDLTPADTSSFVQPELAKALRRFHAQVDEVITSHPPKASEIAALLEKAVHYDLLVLGTLSASLDPTQAEMVQCLLALDIPAVTVALRTPYDLGAYPQASTHVCTFSLMPESMRALARALWGEITFQGQLPVLSALPGG